MNWNERFILYCEAQAGAHDKEAEANELRAAAISPDLDEGKAQEHRREHLRLVKSYRALAADYRRMAEEQRTQAPGRVEATP